MRHRFTLSENHYKKKKKTSQRQVQRGSSDWFLSSPLCLLRECLLRVQGRFTWTEHRACFQLGWLTVTVLLWKSERENTPENNEARAEDGRHPAGRTLRHSKSGESSPGWRLHSKKKHMRKTHSNSQREGAAQEVQPTRGAAGAAAEAWRGETAERRVAEVRRGSQTAQGFFYSQRARKPHAAECYQHQHAAFTSNFRLNNIRRSMSWSHWLPGKCLTAAMGLHHRAADGPFLIHYRAFYQTMLPEDFSNAFVVWFKFCLLAFYSQEGFAQGSDKSWLVLWKDPLAALWDSSEKGVELAAMRLQRGSKS